MIICLETNEIYLFLLIFHDNLAYYLKEFNKN